MNKEETKEYNKKYYAENKEKIKKLQKNYYSKNKEHIKENNKNYRNINSSILSEKKKDYYYNNKEKLKKYKEKNKEKIKEYGKIYFIKNKKELNKKRNIYTKNRKENDNLFKLTLTIRSMISQTIKSNGLRKKLKTEKIIGCNFGYLLIHIEKQFKPWMNWSNYGKYNGNYEFGWDIDHIVELQTAKSEKELLKLNHYSNLRPLDSKINRIDRRFKL